MVDDGNYVFGGSYHFKNYGKRTRLNIFTTFNKSPINGYYYKDNDLKTFIDLHFKRFFYKKISFDNFNSLDYYTLKICVEQKVLTNDEVFFCMKELNEFNRLVLEFNSKKEISDNYLQRVKNQFKHVNRIYNYKKSDIPLLSIPVKSSYGLPCREDYYSLKISDLLKICPQLIEYLILNTDYFCLENFDFQSNILEVDNYFFLEITYRINDIKLAKSKANLKFNSCFEFETNRINNIIEEERLNNNDILESSDLDDYNIPIGDKRYDYYNSLNWINQYSHLLENYISKHM